MPNPTFIQSNSSDTNAFSSGRAAVFTGAQTPGNCNVVHVAISGNAGVILIGDTSGNNYVLAKNSPLSGQSNLYTYVATNIAASPAGINTVTVTLQAAVTSWAIAIVEYGDVAITGLIDGSALGTGTTAGPATTAGVTTTYAADLLVSCAFCHAGNPTGPGAGFTQRVLTPNNELLAQDRLVTSTGTYTATCPLNGTTDWNIILVALKGTPVVQKPLTGGCIGKGVNSGTLSLGNALRGAVTGTMTSTGIMNAAKVLGGTSTVRSAGLTDLFVIKNLFGGCAGKPAHTGDLTVKRILAGNCTATSGNTGNLTRIAAFIGASLTRAVNTGLLYLENQLLGDCLVRANHSDNFVVGERGICTVQTANTGTLFVTNVLEAYTVAADDSAGALSMVNVLSGLCIAQTDMVGLLDPPVHWYMRPTANGLGNGTSWDNSFGSNITWSLIHATDILWVAGGTYTSPLFSTEGNHPQGTTGLPVTIQRVTPSDAIPVASPTYQSSFSTLPAIFPTGWLYATNMSNVIIDGRAPAGIQMKSSASGAVGIGYTHGATYNSENVTFRYLQMVGVQNRTGANNDYGLDLAPQTGINTVNSIRNLLIDHCRIYGWCEAFRFSSNTGTTIQYCYIADTHTANNGAGDHADVVYNYPHVNMTWRYNIINNSPVDGIFHEYGGAQNFYFYGNVYYNSRLHAIYFKGPDNYGPIHILNNTFYCTSNGSDALFLGDGGSGAVYSAGSRCQNNIFYNTANSVSGDGGFAGASGNNTYAPATVNGFGFPTEGGTSFLMPATPVNTFQQVPPSVEGENAIGTEAQNFRILPAQYAGLRHGVTFSPVAGHTLNRDMDGNVRGTGGVWMLGAFDQPGTASRALAGVCTVRNGNINDPLSVGRRFTGTCIARGNSLATLRATKKPAGTCTARANNRGTISTPSINHLAGSCQGKMVGSGALKTSSGASWNDTDATWDSLSVTWNDVFAITALTGTATVRANSSGTLTNTVVTKQLAGVAQVRAAHTGTLRISRLFGICTVRNGNLNDPLSVTRPLIGTCTGRGIHTGTIRSFRVLAGPCEVDAAHTGILRASKRLAGSCTARNGNVNDPLIVTKAVNGLCTVRGLNTGTIKATKAFAGTCTVRGINTGDVDIPSKIVGVCTVRAANSGSVRVTRPLTGTDTVRAANIGTLRSFRVLAGLCTVSANHSDDFAVTKRLTGICTARTQNTGTITVTKRVLGICTVRTLNTGVLAATKQLTGPCTVSAQNVGQLKVSRFVGTCTVRSLNTGVMTITKRLFGIATVRANNFGNMGAFRILAGVCTVFAANTGVITVNRRLTGVCTVTNPNLNDPITVSKTVFGSCTVRGVHTGTIKASKLAVGTCTVRAANLGGLSVSRFRGTCTVLAQNTGTVKVTRFLAGVCTGRAAHTGLLKSFKVLVGACTARAGNFGSLTIPFTPVALVGICTVRAVNTAALRVTKPLIGESTLPIVGVQFVSGNNLGTPKTFVAALFGVNPVFGNLLISMVEWATIGSPTVTVSGGANNAWQQIGTTFVGAGGYSQAIFACIARSNGLTMVANFSTGVTDPVMDLVEYTNTSVVPDGVSSGSSLTGSIDTGIISTTFPNDLLLAFEKANSAVTVTSPGWTTRGTGGVNFFGFAERIPRVLGTYNYTGTVTPPWTASIYAFKANPYGIVKANNTGALISFRAFVGTATVRAQNTGTILVSRNLAGTSTTRAAHTGNLIVIININALAGICTVRASNSGAIKSFRILTGTCTAIAQNTGLLRQQLFRGTCITRMVNTGILKASKLLSGTATVRGQNTGTIRAIKAITGTCTVRTNNFGSLFVAGAATFVTGTCTVRTQNFGLLFTGKPITGICTVRANHAGVITVPKRLTGTCTARGNSFGNLFLKASLRGTCTVRSQNTGFISTFKRLSGTCTVRTVASGSLIARRGPTYTMHFSIRVNNYKWKLHLK